MYEVGDINLDEQSDYTEREKIDISVKNFLGENEYEFYQMIKKISLVAAVNTKKGRKTELNCKVDA